MDGKKSLPINPKYSVSQGSILNKQKCYTLTFTRKPQIIQITYKRDNTGITKVSTIKDREVIFDSKLTVEPHVDTMVKKAYRTLGFLFQPLGKFRKIE